MGRKKNANNLPPFVALTYEMIDSRAFKELTGTGVKTLILFLRKVKTFHPIDRFTFQFPFTFPEAQKKGVPHASFSRALTQLIERGVK